MLKTADYFKDKPEFPMMQEYQAKISGYKDLISEVKVCKTAKQYDAKFKKVELYVVKDQSKLESEVRADAEKILPLVYKYFATQPGFRQLPGTPPPGDLVRKA